VTKTSALVCGVAPRTPPKGEPKSKGEKAVYTTEGQLRWHRERIKRYEEEIAKHPPGSALRYRAARKLRRHIRACLSLTRSPRPT
jgi:hypothetical protein